MSNITPGNWITDPECGDETVIDQNGVLIADCAIFGLEAGITEERCRANAKVVSLVPDMIAFILSQSSRLGHYGGCSNPATPCTKSCIEANRILKEAGVS